MNLPDGVTWISVTIAAIILLSSAVIIYDRMYKWHQRRTYDFNRSIRTFGNENQVIPTDKFDSVNILKKDGPYDYEANS